jgi:hypothetical protein
MSVARVPLIALLRAGYWISLLVALVLAQRKLSPAPRPTRFGPSAHGPCSGSATV